MNIIVQSMRRGARLALASWRILLLAYAASLALVLPLAAIIKGRLGHSLGSSAAGERLREGFDHLWYQGFAADARGLAATFDPSVVGIGAVFDGLDAMVAGHPWSQHPAIVLVGVLYTLLWVFLSAGLIPMYARDARSSFLASAAANFSRFLSLAAIAAVAYGVLFVVLLPALDAAVDRLTRETIDERIHFAYVLGQHALVWLLVWIVAVIFEYARIMAALHRETTLLQAFRGGARLALGNAPWTFGLSAALGLIQLMAVGLYWLVAPGATDRSWITIALAFVLTQVFIVTKIYLRGLGHAAHTKLCQQRLQAAAQRG